MIEAAIAKKKTKLAILETVAAEAVATAETSAEAVTA